jgi:hypothetical protein
LLVQGPVIYVTAAVVVTLLFLGAACAAWVGLVFALVSIAVSVGYYNPVVMSEGARGSLIGSRISCSPGCCSWLQPF